MTVGRRPLLAGMGAALAAPLVARGANAQGAPVRVGFIATLSGPSGYIGEDQRDAWNLAMQEEGGNRLGGVAVQTLLEDDAFRPATAKSISDRMLADGVRLFTGINWSNVLAAVVPGVLEGNAFYVSLNAGPSNYAGRNCHPNYFVVSFQNDAFHEACGLGANQVGYKRMLVMAPNYQAGRDAIAGFRRTFSGEVVGEIFTRLEQTDFSAELSRIRAARPDALYQFHPGGLGINLTKQYANAGLTRDVPMIQAVFAMDERMIAATGDAAEGLYTGGSWSSELDHAPSRRFVEAFRRAYNRTPTIYAGQAYDTAKLIGSALRAVGGDLRKAAEFRAAMRAAQFESIRTGFRMGPNQHPIQDYYLFRVERGANNELLHKPQNRIAEARGDVFAAECRMPSA
ncbi:ABC transporter substrate-binding protein [Roseomonas sp. CCTCC AB2023176]|uniref:ABC transporter substrate-binding protein n=1 Tax=Roseomonas sp. CCTCC AB2023176 TaxID=3342640 RepID=UPI0035D7F839